MAGLKKFKSTSLVALCTTMLVGFSGQEKYVELTGYLNARSSGSFRSSDANVISLLTKGTHGEILSYKRLTSGNYGLKVRITNGKQQGQEAWIYYNVSAPSIALYKTAPQNWQHSENAKRDVATVVEDSRGAETLEEVPFFPEEPSVTSPREAAKQTVDLIERTNSRARETGRPTSPTTPGCVECSTRVESPKPVLIYPARKERMANQCSNIMDSRGRLGSIGKSLMSIMSEKRYQSNFTSSNAMGYLCPRFNTLTKTQKLQAWTWFWTALGHEESQCQLHVVHPTEYIDSNGKSRILNPRKGYGIWAMELDAIYRDRRGSACKNISTAAGQARCSIDILYKQQLSQGYNLTNSRLKYWGPVKRGRDQLLHHMRRFNLCF